MIRRAQVRSVWEYSRCAGALSADECGMWNVVRKEEDAGLVRRVAYR